MIRPLYTYKFFSDLVLLYPVYTLLFAANGLSAFDISLLFIIWSISAIIFEIPSGAWADRYSRRNLLIVSEILTGIGFLGWFCFQNFTGFAIGFVLWGAAMAITSGTFQALLYDELTARKQQKSYARILGKTESLSFFAIYLTTLGAAAALQSGYALIVALSLAAKIIAVISLLLLPNVKARKSVDESITASIRRGAKLAFSNPHVIKVFVIGGFLGIIFETLREYDALFLKDLGIPDASIPLVFALMGPVTVIGSYVAYKLELWKEWLLMLLLIVSGASLVLANYAPMAAGIALLSLFLFSMKALNTVYAARLQHAINSNLRATVTSFSGFIARVGAVIGFILFGILANRINYVATYSVFGAVIIIGALANITYSYLTAQHTSIPKQSQ